MIRTVRALLVVALAATACTGDTPATDPTASETASTDPSPSETGPPPPPRARAMAYVTTFGSSGAFGDETGDLWYFDVEANATTRLTDDGADAREEMPRFVREDLIVYLVHEDAATTVFTVDPGDPEPAELFSSSRRIASIDPEPAGERYAYLRQDGRRLRIVLWNDGTSEVLRTIDPGASFGRGGAEDDEIAVRWSPDGSRLLVVYTPFDMTEETLWILDAGTGEDVVTPRFGTFGRWLPDGASVLWRRWDDQGAWRMLDVADDEDVTIDMRAGYRPAISPDGVHVAYDTGGDEPTLRVFRLEDGTDRALADAHALAQWLTVSGVIASGTTACSEDPECIEGISSPWLPDGTTARVPLAGGAPGARNARSTYQAAMLFS